MGGATLTPSPPPADVLIAVSCLSNRVSSRTFLRWEFSDSCTCASSDCSYNTKSFHKSFTLSPSALALTAASCLLKRGQARKQCVPPRYSHSTHLTTHFVGVHTLSINNSYSSLHFCKYNCFQQNYSSMFVSEPFEFR